MTAKPYTEAEILKWPALGPMNLDMYRMLATVKAAAERDELHADFAKRQAAHCCPAWDDQAGDCDCDERMVRLVIERNEARTLLAAAQNHAEEAQSIARESMTRFDEMHAMFKEEKARAALAATPPASHQTG